MIPKRILNPLTFPRPPLCEPTTRHLQIKWNDHIIADTTEAYWVLETHHPPTYYFPPASVKIPLIRSSRRTFCEWKGAATYWNVVDPAADPQKVGDAGGQRVENRIWSYGEPTKGFEAIKGYLCFYVGPWRCFVDGEEVEAQPGDFYGGWLTSDVDRKGVKGRPGTLAW